MMFQSSQWMAGITSATGKDAGWLSRQALRDETAVINKVGFLVGGLALTVLLGWILDIPSLTRIASSYASMTPVTAMLFALTGLACVFVRRSKSGGDLDLGAQPNLPLLVASGSVVVAAAVCAFAFGDVIIVNPDTTQAHARQVGDPFQNMTPMTAACFLLVGGSLAAIATRRERALSVAAAFSVLAFLASIFGLVGYVVGSDALYELSPFKSMALHTALGFITLSVAIFFYVDQTLKNYGARPHSSIHRRAAVIWLVLSVFEIACAVFEFELSPTKSERLVGFLVIKVAATIAIVGVLTLAVANLISIYESQRRAAFARLAVSEEQFRTSFEDAALGMEIVDGDGVRLDVNRKLCELLKVERETLVGSNIWDRTHADDREAGVNFLRDLRSGSISRYEREKRMTCGNNQERWFKVAASRRHGSDSEGFVLILDDIHDKKLAEMSRDLLMAEVNHRVKNTLGVIQGMVRQMLASADSLKSFGDAFQAGLHSMSATYDLLNFSSWKSVTLKDWLLSEISVFAPYHHRLDIDMAEVELEPQVAINAALVLHELMTNAIKHGSLSNEHGRVSLMTEATKKGDNHWVTLKWIESGGPPVVKPTRQGFGSVILGGNVTFNLNGTTKQTFAPEGLLVEIAFPASQRKFRHDLSGSHLERS